jgi:TrmH family RNA methyltransferase
MTTCCMYKAIAILIVSATMTSNGLLHLRQSSVSTGKPIKFGIFSRNISYRHKISMSKVDSDSDYLLQYMLLVSPTNDKIKLLKSLHLKKKRDSENLLLLEGHRQVIDAINGGYSPSTLLFSDEAINAPLGQLLLSALKKCAPPTIFRASTELIQSISDTVQCQGIVASFSRPEIKIELPDVVSPLIILMDKPADPGNLGTIIRTAYGMGVDAIIIADGCDPWSPKVLRSAMGMCLKLPILEMSWKDGSIPELLLNKGGSYQVLLADADPSGQVYHKVNMTGPTVIVVGSEATGIGPAARALPDAKFIQIPSSPHRGDLESLNAAVACSILISEAARQRGI